jgi:hypothetical protein
MNQNNSNFLPTPKNGTLLDGRAELEITTLHSRPVVEKEKERNGVRSE